jgi:outer membrane protein TolC
MKTEGHSRFARAVFTLATALACAGPLSAQQLPPPAAGAAVGATVRLSLDDALRLAEAQSPNIEVARSNVVRANGQRYQVRSQFFPQLNATAGYNKTLGRSSRASPRLRRRSTRRRSCRRSAPEIPANATPDQRLAALAQFLLAIIHVGAGFAKTSFGAKNQWTLGLNFSQNVYTGGRITAQADAANAQLSSANIEVSAQRAQSALDVTSAYYDAALADQLVAIADSSVAQTEVVLAQTRVARQVGNAAEYDLLRAQVTRDNQLPIAIQARACVPASQAAAQHAARQRREPRRKSRRPKGLRTFRRSRRRRSTRRSRRAPVRELDEAVRASEAQIKVARASGPTLAIVLRFGLYFPQQLFPSSNFGVNN